MNQPAPSNPIPLMSTDLFGDLSTELLRQGKSIRFRAPGRSMYPTIREGEAITVDPIEPSSINIGDIILYRQDTSVVAHRVVRIIKTELSPPCSLDAEHQSNDTRHAFLFRCDTWGKEDLKPVTGAQILGKVIAVERNGRQVDPCSRKAQIRLLVHTMASRIKKWIL
jgi:signal peptidase I